MRADGKIIAVARAGSPPVMELVFGYAQWGEYKVRRWSTTGQRIPVREGLNNDNIPDKFPISPTTAELDGQKLSWQAVIGALGSQGQVYSLRVILTQDGRPLCPPFEETGPLDGPKVLYDFVVLDVV